MQEKDTCVINTILWAIAILLLLAAAFDILPFADNVVIFAALACFIISAAIKRISKGSGSCCK